MGFGYFFDKETFGTERLVTNYPESRHDTSVAWADFLAKTPLSAETLRDIIRIEECKAYYMEGLSQAEKKVSPVPDEL